MIKHFWPWLIYWPILVIGERWLPVVIGVAGVMAAVKAYSPRTAYLTAFLTGMVMDVTWGRTLGLSSIWLIVTVWLVLMIQVQLTQWWLYLSLTVLSGAGLMWRYEGGLNIWGLISLPFITWAWWWWFNRAERQAAGLYLRRPT